MPGARLWKRVLARRRAIGFCLTVVGSVAVIAVAVVSPRLGWALQTSAGLDALCGLAVAIGIRLTCRGDVRSDPVEGVRSRSLPPSTSQTKEHDAEH